jgi:hypothetical protein
LNFETCPDGVSGNVIAFVARSCVGGNAGSRIDDDYGMEASIMRRLSCLAAFVLVLGSGVSSSSAGIITFSGLVGGNGDSFTTYTEGGFRVAVNSGTWSEAHLFGNPVPDIFGSSNTGIIDVTEVPSGTFTFSRVDLADALNGGTTYTIQGLLSNAVVFSASGTLSTGSFVTIASPNSGQPIDLLRIIMNRSAATYNIDNIAVFPTAVPEPATIALLAIGLAGISFGARLARPRPM